MMLQTTTDDGDGRNTVVRPCAYTVG